MENRLEILEVYLHHLKKGKISITTYRMITQAIELMNTNDKSTANVMEAINRDLQDMSNGIYNLFTFK